MLELISIAAGLIACIMMPFELGRIRKGWVGRKFAGDRPRFLAAYRKQIRLLMWLGLVFGVLGIGMAAIAPRDEAIGKLVAAIVWLVVSGIAFFTHGQLVKIPATAPAGSSGA